jgi:CDP-glycerol glycerophosphotransferase (TagB/SpsB family)
MAKEWTNKNSYHPSHGMLEPRMPLPKGKGVVYMVSTWRDRELQVEASLLAEYHRPDRSE